MLWLLFAARFLTAVLSLCSKGVTLAQQLRRKLKNAFNDGNVIMPEPDRPYSLLKPGGTTTYGGWSQDRQDICIDRLLSNMSGGFFLEAGAYDGEAFSNSLYFETRRKWSGLLVEPNLHLVRKIRQLNRKCMLINAGLSITNETTYIPFKLAGPLGGFVSHYTSEHKERVDREIRNKEFWMSGEEGSGKVIDIPCYPLHKLLADSGSKDLIVDYFSLDTEGSEVAILKAIDFDQVTIGIMTIEFAFQDANRLKDITDVMTSKGFVQHSILALDVIFYNPKYFSSKSLALPSTIKC